jgi:hypothetical protein
VLRLTGRGRKESQKWIVASWVFVRNGSNHDLAFCPPHEVMSEKCHERTCRRARLCEGSGQPDIHRVIKLA